MKRLGLKLEESEIAWKYQNNTVIISYDKPDKIIELEKKKAADLQKMGAQDGSYGGKGSSSSYQSGSATKSLLGPSSGDATNPDCK